LMPVPTIAVGLSCDTNPPDGGTKESSDGCAQAEGDPRNANPAARTIMNSFIEEAARQATGAGG
jgi:hypothetical protein